MTNRRSSVLLRRLALMVALTAVVLTAASSAPADVTQTSAVWAYYNYDLEEPANCRTSASVAVGKELPRGGTESMTPATLYVALNRFGCDEGTNYAIGTFSEIPRDEFQVDGSTATLDTSFVEFDRVSGRRVDLALQLEWTDNGELIQAQQAHAHVMSPGSVSNNHFRTTFSGADITGSISDGETEFMKEPSVAVLQSFDAGTVFIDRARMKALLETAGAAAASGSANAQASYANAHWLDTDPTGCVSREVVLSVTAHETGTDLFAGVTSWNSCTGEYPYWIFLSEPLDEDEFSISRLDGASLTASIEAIDSVTLMPVTIDFDLDWSPAGGVTRYNNGFVDRSYGRHLNMHETGSYRSANATGTVSIGSLNVLPDQFDYTLLGQLHSTAHEVSR